MQIGRMSHFPYGTNLVQRSPLLKYTLHNASFVQSGIPAC